MINILFYVIAWYMSGLIISVVWIYWDYIHHEPITGEHITMMFAVALFGPILGIMGFYGWLEENSHTVLFQRKRNSKKD